MEVGGTGAGDISKNLASQVDISVTKMALDVSKQNAQAMVDTMNASAKQMERSLNPSLGGAIDLRI